jgi:hypothetical protein
MAKRDRPATEDEIEAPKGDVTEEMISRGAAIIANFFDVGVDQLVNQLARDVFVGMCEIQVSSPARCRPSSKASGTRRRSS